MDARVLMQEPKERLVNAIAQALPVGGLGTLWGFGGVGPASHVDQHGGRCGVLNDGEHVRAHPAVRRAGGLHELGLPAAGGLTGEGFVGGAAVLERGEAAALAIERLPEGERFDAEGLGVTGVDVDADESADRSSVRHPGTEVQVGALAGLQGTVARAGHGHVDALSLQNAVDSREARASSKTWWGRVMRAPRCR